jgi:AAA+ ATPase superfamily predicted ATPase
MLLGREKELALLEEGYAKSTAQLIAVYGRRRVGKSALIAEFGRAKALFAFEGLESQSTAKQIQHFQNTLCTYIPDELLPRIRFNDWNQIFLYLTEKIKASPKKIILLFDEFQWMAANQSKLVSIIKYYWDTHWKHLRVYLILCGSIASFMVNKVIKSKALYGRINTELLITELRPFEVQQFFKKKRSFQEILQYLLVIGGIPKYYELIDIRKSFEKNVLALFFETSGYLFNEYEKIFYSQFKEHKIYEAIVAYLSEGPKSLDEIARKISLTSGGGAKRYLSNLELARFIRSYTPIQRENSNVIKYVIFDEYLHFYFKYILPSRDKIIKGLGLAQFNNMVKMNWSPWLGFAFEKFCLKNALTICRALNIFEVTEDYGPYFHRGDPAFQIDLVIRRSDKTWNICECKYYDKPVGVEVVKEFQVKVAALKLPRGYSLEKTLITVNGIDPSLQKLEYFDSVLTVEDFFNLGAAVESSRYVRGS